MTSGDGESGGGGGWGERNKEEGGEGCGRGSLEGENEEWRGRERGGVQIGVIGLWITVNGNNPILPYAALCDPILPHLTL